MNTRYKTSHTIISGMNETKEFMGVQCAFAFGKRALRLPVQIEPEQFCVRLTQGYILHKSKLMALALQSTY